MEYKTQKIYSRASITRTTRERGNPSNYGDIRVVEVFKAFIRTRGLRFCSRVMETFELEVRVIETGKKEIARIMKTFEL